MRYSDNTEGQSATPKQTQGHHERDIYAIEERCVRLSSMIRVMILGPRVWHIVTPVRARKGRGRKDQQFGAASGGP